MTTGPDRTKDREAGRETDGKTGSVREEGGRVTSADARGRVLSDVGEAVAALSSGSCLVAPTETFFGLVCDARDPAAVARIYQLKKRTATKPLPLVAASRAMAERFCDLSSIPGALLALWPGPLTLVLKSRFPFPAPLLDKEGCVALRVSAHPAARALSEGVGAPVTATSANTQGMPPATDPAGLEPELARVPLLDVAPRPAGGEPSTILLPLRDGRFGLIREGAVSARALLDLGIDLTAVR